jgi:hypothetical protein
MHCAGAADAAVQWVSARAYSRVFTFASVRHPTPPPPPWRSLHRVKHIFKYFVLRWINRIGWGYYACIICFSLKLLLLLVQLIVHTSLLKMGKQTLESAVTREYYEDTVSFEIIILWLLLLLLLLSVLYHICNWHPNFTVFYFTSYFRIFQVTDMAYSPSPSHIL